MWMRFGKSSNSPLSTDANYSAASRRFILSWSDALKTFGVRLDDELFGTVELKRDEDEADTWELALVLVEHKRSLDSARF